MSIEQWTQRRWSYVDGENRADVIIESAPGKFDIIQGWRAQTPDELKMVHAALGQLLTDLAADSEAERIIESALT